MDKQSAIQLVTEKPISLWSMSDEFRNDIDIVRAASTQSGKALRYASDALRDNFELVIYAVKNHPQACEYASPRLRDDINFWTTLREETNQFQPSILGYLRLIGPTVCDDRDFMCSLLTIADFGVVDRAGPNLRKDKTFLLAAAREHHFHSEYLLTEELIDKSIWADSDFVMQLFEADYQIAINLKLKLKEYLAPELINNKETVLKILSFSPDAAVWLQFVNNELTDDENFLLQAIHFSDHRGNALQYASKRLRHNPDFIKKAVMIRPRILAFAPNEIKCDRDIVLTALKVDGNALYEIKDVCNQLCDDEEIMQTAMDYDPSKFEFASDRLRCDKAFVAKALAASETNRHYAYPKLYNIKSIPGWLKFKFLRFAHSFLGEFLYIALIVGIIFLVSLGVYYEIKAVAIEYFPIADYEQYFQILLPILFATFAKAAKYIYFKEWRQKTK